MNIECTVCHTRYSIADSLVPPQGARFKCRRCSAVIAIAAPVIELAPTELEVIPPPACSSVPARPAPAAPAAPQVAPESTMPSPAVGSTISGAGGTPIPEGLSPEERAKHEKARRLARVLASDIAIYNREKRERGIKDGNLVAVLGYEIKKSWETYKERVTPEFANASPYFRDALNEMLAEGKKIF